MSALSPPTAWCRACGPAAEPAVACIDEDCAPQKIADSFADFMTRLETADDIGS